ncbi:hypothetical protein C5613_41490 [Rhodococcus opacus]|uniref:Uncharacterized protein n=1 Tax=Rhodococcus opacus TaxID=37919 RepID=A0A2S8IH65_RHOOP|nr:hypothetical protein C5613_41490 [Rhodococcus opacus]
MAYNAAGYRIAAAYNERARDRDGSRELDQIVVDAAFTRARKDLERAFSRAMVPEVSECKRREPDAQEARRGIRDRD